MNGMENTIHSSRKQSFDVEMKLFFVFFAAIFLSVSGNRFVGMRQAAFTRHHGRPKEPMSRRESGQERPGVGSPDGEFDSLTFRLEHSFRTWKLVNKAAQPDTKSLLLDNYKRYFSKFN